MARERSPESARVLPQESVPGVSIAEVRQIIALMRTGDIQEIIIERETGALKLHLRKPAPEVSAVASIEGQAFLPDGVAVSEAAGSDAADGHVAITAPFVGRFHSGGKSNARGLAKVGDQVSPGQVVGAIQTLNIVSEVEAEQAGRITEVKVQEGQAVEYGQVLMLIEPGRS